MAAAVQQQQNKSIIEIYTDWTNHYLDKLKGRQRIRDLQTELADGLVLADVIEAVTSARVPDIVRKPKTSAQVSMPRAPLLFDTCSNPDFDLKLLIRSR